MRSRPKGLLVLLMCLGFPSLGRADTGLPMIFVEWPAMLLALVPVVLIEAAVYRRELRIPFRQALHPAGVANAASTLIGYPFAWLLRLAALFVLLDPLAKVAKPSQALIALVYSAWLPPEGEQAMWMLPAASLVGLVPAYFVSVYVEAWALRRLMKGKDRRVIRTLSYKANLASYVFLAACAVCMLVGLAIRGR